jgi:hypothetical protein
MIATGWRGAIERPAVISDAGKVRDPEPIITNGQILESRCIIKAKANMDSGLLASLDPGMTGNE